MLLLIPYNSYSHNNSAYIDFSKNHVVHSGFTPENNKAEIFWDCDDSFIDNPEHEAGYFFRKYISDWDYFKTKKFKWSKK